jgi:aldose 1-epimerase
VRPPLRLLMPSCLLLFFVPFARGAATVTHTAWGKDPAGDVVELYTIASRRAEVKVSTYGARIVSIRVPDRNGKMANVVEGYDSVDGYFSGRTSAMGATIGRFANRIAGGEFMIDGVRYHIPKNSGENALHGGTIGFDRKTWSATAVKDGVELTLHSPDQDMGFPGNLIVQVAFTLRESHSGSSLTIAYSAVTDKPTVINLTNHSYFNLANDPQVAVLGDLATFSAKSYTPTDGGGIPTGEVKPVDGTPVDFRQTRAIGDRIPARGYDNNLVLDPLTLKQLAVEVHDPESGRTLQVFTTEPGFQFYVPLFPSPPASTARADTASRASSIEAFCIETQHFPDSPNHTNFPSTALRPGKRFGSTTIYRFGVSQN